MLANFSNHPSAVWSAEQKSAAAEYGEIRDLTFPAVPAGADTADVSALADECCREILASALTRFWCRVRCRFRLQSRADFRYAA